MCEKIIHIILPVRNGGSYLPVAVNSIVNQTSADWKLYILENHSVDDTYSYLDSLKDPRISIHTSDRPLTIEENWDRAKVLPINGYATFIGHDDVYRKDFVAIAQESITSYPDASVWQTNFEIIDASGNFVRSASLIPEREDGEDFLRARWHHKRDSYGTGYVFKFKDYCEIGGIPSFPGLLYADDLLWYRLTKKTWKYASPEIAFQYRSHNNSAAKTSKCDDIINAFQYFFESLNELAKNNDVLQQLLLEEGRGYIAHVELCRQMEAARQGNEFSLPSSWRILVTTYPLRRKDWRLLLLSRIWKIARQLKCGPLLYRLHELYHKTPSGTVVG